MRSAPTQNGLGYRHKMQALRLYQWYSRRACILIDFPNCLGWGLISLKLKMGAEMMIGEMGVGALCCGMVPRGTL